MNITNKEYEPLTKYYITLTVTINMQIVPLFSVVVEKELTATEIGTNSYFHIMMNLNGSIRQSLKHALGRVKVSSVHTTINHLCNLILSLNRLFDGFWIVQVHSQVFPRKAKASKDGSRKFKIRRIFYGTSAFKIQF